MNDKRLLGSQAKALKDWLNKSGPISYDTTTTIIACLGFRHLPKFINNRLDAVPTKYDFSDWIGIWTTLATGGLALSYGGVQGLKYWSVGQVIGNLTGVAMYSIE